MACVGVHTAGRRVDSEHGLYTGYTGYDFLWALARLVEAGWSGELLVKAVREIGEEYTTTRPTCDNVRAAAGSHAPDPCPAHDEREWKCSTRSTLDKHGAGPRRENKIGLESQKRVCDPNGFEPKQSKPDQDSSARQIPVQYVVCCAARHHVPHHRARLGRRRSPDGAGGDGRCRCDGFPESNDDDDNSDGEFNTMAIVSPR